MPGLIFQSQPSLRPRMRRRLQKAARPPNTLTAAGMVGQAVPMWSWGVVGDVGGGDLGRCAGAPRADFQSVRRGGCRLS